MTQLQSCEMTEVVGGWSWKSLAKRLGVAGLLIDALDNIEDIRDGWHDGWNEKSPRHQSS